MPATQHQVGILVSIIIVNYNTMQLTCNCIDSIIDFVKDIDYEIILVDNASSKDDPNHFIARYPQVNVIASSENLGFAGGNNLGIAAAKGNLILLLNSDAYLIDDGISAPAHFLNEHPEIGALTVRLVYENRKYQHNARKFRSIRNEVLDLLRPILLLLPYRRRATLMLNQYFNGDFDTYCDWVSGAYMMFRRSSLNKLPGRQLDERFFMYGEDQLWCYQFAQLGLRGYFMANHTVVHIANASTEPAKQLKIVKNNISRELDIMRYRQKSALYYSIFALIFKAKERARYMVKVMVYKLSGRQLK